MLNVKIWPLYLCIQTSIINIANFKRIKINVQMNKINYKYHFTYFCQLIINLGGALYVF